MLSCSHSLFFLFALFDGPVTERATKAKRMQLLSGVHLGVFWGTSGAFDLVNYLVPTVINVVLFVAFAVPSYSGPQLGYVLT